MIIFSEIKLEIGKIYGPKTYPGKFLHVRKQVHKEFRFMVLRESNYDEYKEEYEKNYGPTKLKPLYDNFYLISLD